MMIRRVAPPPDSQRGYAAGFVTRYLAFLIDIVLVAGVALLTVTVTRTTLAFFGFDQVLDYLLKPLDLGTRVQVLSGAARWGITVGGGFVAFGVYSALAWMLVGKTVGKALMGLRVLGRDGRRLTWRQAAVRSLAYYVSALPLFLGYLWVLVDDERRTWHDKLAKTIVVYEWDAHYEERLAGTVQVLSNSAARRQAAREEALRLTIEGDEATETGNG